MSPRTPPFVFPHTSFCLPATLLLSSRNPPFVFPQPFFCQSRTPTFVFPQPSLCLPATLSLSSRTQIRDPGFLLAPAFARVTKKRARTTGPPFVAPHLPLSSRTQIRDPSIYMAPRFREGDKKKSEDDRHSAGATSILCPI